MGTPATVWFTGLPGAGKTTVASTLLGLLGPDTSWPVVLDGDALRKGLSSDLSFSEADRAENVRRIGEVALLLARAGHLVLVSVIAAFASGRLAVRARHECYGVPYVEVHVATPLSVCEERDPKGLYARARRGELPSFTGVSSPYEPPESPELALDTTGRTPEECARAVLEVLDARGILEAGGL